MTHLLPCFINLLYYTLNNSVDSFIVSKFYKFHDFNKILSNSGNYGDHLETFGNTVHSVTSLKLTENDVNPLNLVADDGDLSNSSTGVEVLDGDSEKESLEYLKLNDYMCSSFLKYALSIILGRALPDSRDGLKVVHRRIIWAMHVSPTLYTINYIMLTIVIILYRVRSPYRTVDNFFEKILDVETGSEWSVS